MLRHIILKLRPPPTPTLFPYTTLFRSRADRPGPARGAEKHRLGVRQHQRRRLRRVSAEALRCHVELRRKRGDRKSTRLNSSHRCISYAVFCSKKKKKKGRTGTWNLRAN